MPSIKQLLTIAAVTVVTLAILNRVAPRVPLVAAVVNG